MNLRDKQNDEAASASRGMQQGNATIAESYLQLHRQPRSAWAWEIERRPWVENF
jgi:hypothetical protein